MPIAAFLRRLRRWALFASLLLCAVPGHTLESEQRLLAAVISNDPVTIRKLVTEGAFVGPEEIGVAAALALPKAVETLLEAPSVDIKKHGCDLMKASAIFALKRDDYPFQIKIGGTNSRQGQKLEIRFDQRYWLEQLKRPNRMRDAMKIAELLMARGASTDCQLTHSTLIASIAKTSNTTDFLRILLRHGANPNFETLNPGGDRPKSPLFHALYRLSREGCFDIRAADLRRHADETVEIVEMLLVAGANPRFTAKGYRNNWPVYNLYIDTYERPEFWNPTLRILKLLFKHGATIKLEEVKKIVERQDRNKHDGESGQNSGMKQFDEDFYRLLSENYKP